jgi:hypothetical protein
MVFLGKRIVVSERTIRSKVAVIQNVVSHYLYRILPPCGQKKKRKGGGKKKVFHAGYFK